MEKEKIIENVGVIDRWYPDWGVGTIKKVLKTVIHVYFGDCKEVNNYGVIKYDYAHAIKFLETEEDYRKLVQDKSKKHSKMTSYIIEGEVMDIHIGVIFLSHLFCKGIRLCLVAYPPTFKLSTNQQNVLL